MAGRSTETQVGLKINGEPASNTIKDLQNDVKTLSKELRQLPADTEAFNNKAKELGEAQNRLDDIRNSAKDVREQMRLMGDNAKQARADLLSMSPAGRMLNDFKDNFMAVRGAIAANASALGVFRVALAATGIGAVVLALTALYTYFTKTDEGAVKLAGIMKGLEIVFNKVTQAVASMGEYLIGAFENPKQAMTDLSDFIVNNLINRFKAFGVILEAIMEADFKKMTDGSVQLATGIENATGKMANLKKEIDSAVEAGSEYAKMADAIDEAETKSIKNNALAEEQISRLILQAKDRTKSEGERLVLLDRASALEKQRLQETIALQQMKVQQAKDDLATVSRLSDEYDVKNRVVAESEAALILLRKDSIDLQEKISTRRNALLDGEANKKAVMKAAEEKANEDAAKAELEYLRKLSDLRIANVVDEDERKRITILENYKRGLEDAFANGKQTEELAKELLIQRDNALIALDAEIEERKIKEAEEKANKKLADDQAALDVETAARVFAAEQVVGSEIVKEQRLYEAKRMGLENRLKLLRDANKAETAEYQKANLELMKLDTDHSKKQIDLTQKTEDQKSKLTLMAFNQAVGLASDFATLLSKDEASRRRYADIIKAIKIAEITMSGVNEIAKIWEFANSNPLNALIPGWGPAFAGVQTGFAVARTAFAVGKAAGLTFESGGVISPRGGTVNTGQRHRNGGIQMFDGSTGMHLGEMERGEAIHIYSRDTVANNGDIINALLDSSLYGGGSRITRKFETGGSIDMAASNAASGPDTAANNATSSAMLQQLQMLNYNFQKFPTVLRAVTDYEQNNRVAMEAADIEAGANA
jgi:hypothetical protein